MHTVQWQSAVIQQSIVSKRCFPLQRSIIGLIAEYVLSRIAVSAEQPRDDGITLCREPPTAENEGEIVVACQMPRIIQDPPMAQRAHAGDMPQF
jgi:hypothetical protein